MGSSRIRLQPHSTSLHPGREVHVGWDKGLQSYFAQVVDGRDEHGEDRITLDLGNSLGDITYPGGVISALRPYAEIPDDLGELLNVSRVSTVSTYTDLRPDSRSYQQDTYVQEGMRRLYRPDGFITELTRDEVAPMLTEHGWTAGDIRATGTGHAETYRRGDQDLTLVWTWPDEHNDAERLLSPVHVDGGRHGVHSRERLSSLLAEGSPDPQILTPGSEERIDELLSDVLAEHEAERLNDAVSEEPWFDDPPSEDEGFRSGLGT